MIGLVIRRGEPADIGHVHKLNLALFPESWSEQGLSDALQQGYELLIAEFAGIFSGYLLSMDILDETHILQVAVIPGMQQRGVATALSERLIQQKSAASQHKLLLEVRASNRPAQELYSRLGFHAVGRRKCYYRPLDGHSAYEDALLMDLRLNARTT